MSPEDVEHEVTSNGDDDVVAPPEANVCLECHQQIDPTHTEEIKQRQCRDCREKQGSSVVVSVHSVNVQGESLEANRKCLECRSCCFACTRPCAYRELKDNAGCCEALLHAFLCPPFGRVGKWYTRLIFLLFFWGALWGVTGKEALPGGNFFALLVTFACAVVAGDIVSLIRLPPLLGMLIAGGILGNVPHIDIAKDIDEEWSASLRTIALVVILIRAGLGLDPEALKKLSFGVIRLAFLPCLVEATTAAVTSHLILGFPWNWGFLLGFVLAAVSPAVVVPSLLALQEQGWGVDKGIPTLVIAAASVDDVLAISGFGVVLGITFSTGEIWVSLIKGPCEALLGLVYGLVFGVLLWYIPNKSSSSRDAFRFTLLISLGLLAMFGSREADLSGAGALGVLAIAFVAGLKWRKELPEGQDKIPVEDTMGFLWLIFQPLLFALIGAAVEIRAIDPTTIGFGLAVLGICLVLRCIVSFLAVFKLGFSYREMLFIPFAWLPKATVQAAIGAVALDTVREKHPDDTELEELGIELLTIAVLSILVTAPIGAVAIKLMAPKLLHKSERATVVTVTKPKTAVDGVVATDTNDTDDVKLSIKENDVSDEDQATVTPL